MVWVTRVLGSIFRAGRDIKSIQSNPEQEHQVSQSAAQPGLWTFKIWFICAPGLLCWTFPLGCLIFANCFLKGFKGIYFGALQLLPPCWSWFSTSPDKKMDKAPFPQCVMDRADLTSLCSDLLWITRKQQKGDAWMWFLCCDELSLLWDNFKIIKQIFFRIFLSFLFFFVQTT